MSGAKYHPHSRVSPFLPFAATHGQTIQEFRALAGRTRGRPLCETRARGGLAFARRVQARGNPARRPVAAPRDDRARPRCGAGRLEPVRRPPARGRGRIIAIDILEMPAIPGVEFLQGDFNDESVLEQLQAPGRPGRGRSCNVRHGPQHDGRGGCGPRPLHATRGTRSGLCRSELCDRGAISS